MKRFEWFGVIFGMVCVLCIIGCETSPSAAKMAKYTNEQALAIVEAGWKIGGSIVIAAVIRAIFNK